MYLMSACFPMAWVCVRREYTQIYSERRRQSGEFGVEGLDENNHVVHFLFHAVHASFDLIHTGFHAFHASFDLEFFRGCYGNQMCRCQICDD